MASLSSYPRGPAPSAAVGAGLVPGSGYPNAPTAAHIAQHLTPPADYDPGTCYCRDVQGNPEPAMLITGQSLDGVRRRATSDLKRTGAMLWKFVGIVNNCPTSRGRST